MSKKQIQGTLLNFFRKPISEPNNISSSSSQLTSISEPTAGSSRQSSLMQSTSTFDISNDTSLNKSDAELHSPPSKKNKKKIYSSIPCRLFEIWVY